MPTAGHQFTSNILIAYVSLQNNLNDHTVPIMCLYYWYFSLSTDTYPPVSTVVTSPTQIDYFTLGKMTELINWSNYITKHPFEEGVEQEITKVSPLLLHWHSNARSGLTAPADLRSSRELGAIFIPKHARLSENLEKVHETCSRQPDRKLVLFAATEKPSVPGKCSVLAIRDKLITFNLLLLTVIVYFISY